MVAQSSVKIMDICVILDFRKNKKKNTVIIYSQLFKFVLHHCKLVLIIQRLRVGLVLAASCRACFKCGDAGLTEGCWSLRKTSNVMPLDLPKVVRACEMLQKNDGYFALSFLIHS